MKSYPDQQSSEKGCMAKQLKYCANNKDGEISSIMNNVNNIYLPIGIHIEILLFY